MRNTPQNNADAFTPYGKVPPQALESEKAVLGALMLEPHAIDLAAAILKPESFYSEAHQHTYRAICSLSQKSQPIDIITVVQELMSAGNLERAGGAYFVTTLTNSVVSAANIETHARIIQQMFIARELIRIAGQLTVDAFDPGNDVFELLDRAEAEILSISQDNIHQDMTDMPQALQQTLTQIEEWRKMESSLTGVPTGFDALDKATRGWQPSDLVILGARPSVGKSAFALRLVRAAAGAGFPVGFFSLEMRTVQLLLRMISAETGILLDRIQRGRLDDDAMNIIHRKGVQKLAGLPVYLDDKPGLTLMGFRGKCRRLVRKHAVKLIIIDYLQLMSGDDNEKNREREIAKISRSLKNLARELNIPIIALSQMSREVEKRTGSKRKPQLSDLRESGAIEQDADMVMFLWAPDEDEMEQDADLVIRRYLKIAKHRSGTLMTMELDFENEIQLFKEREGGFSKPSSLPDSPGRWKPIPENRMPFKDNE